MTSNVDIVLKAQGIQNVQGALKSIKDSLASVSKEAELSSKLQIAADKAVIASAKEKIRLIKEEAAVRKAVSPHDKAIIEGRREIAQAQERIRLLKVESDLRRAMGSSRGGSSGGGFGAGGSGDLTNAVKSLSVFGSGIMGAARAFNAAGAAGLGVNLAFQAMSSAVDIATEALKTFGSFILNDIVKPQFRHETEYLQLSNRSAGGLSAEEAEKAGKRALIKWNLSEEEGVKALGIYGSKGGAGSWKDSPKALEFIAMEAKARGEPASEIAEAFAAQRASHPNESFDDTRKRYLMLQKQSDIFNLPIEKMGGTGKELGLVSSRLKGNEFEQSAEANAMLQVLVPHMKSAPEALTSMRRLQDDILKNPHGFGKGTVSRQNGIQTVDMFAAMENILGRTGGDITKIKSIGIKDVRGQRTISALLPEFSKAYAEDKKAGMTDDQARHDAAKKVIDVQRELARVTGSLAEEQEKAEAVMKTTNEQWQNAINEMKMAIMNDIMPTARELAGSLLANKEQIITAAVTLADALMKLADFIGENFGDKEKYEGNKVVAAQKDLEKYEKEHGFFTPKQQSDEENTQHDKLLAARDKALNKFNEDNMSIFGDKKKFATDNNGDLSLTNTQDGQQKTQKLTQEISNYTDFNVKVTVEKKEGGGGIPRTSPPQKF